MSNEDLEIIPILDDVVVAGDLDKAVTGDIDINDLESIESFDALFEDSNTKGDENDHAQEAAEENRIDSSDEMTSACDESPDDYSFESSGFDSHIEEQDNSSYEEESSTEAIEVTAYTDSEPESLNDTKNEDTGIENADFEKATDAHEEPAYFETDFFPQASQLYDNQSLIEQTFEDIESEEEAESTSAPEYDFQNDSYSAAAQIDAAQIVEKVMQEIMPELETHIRSIVLASLEKHLTDTIDTPHSESSTESDTSDN